MKANYPATGPARHRHRREKSKTSRSYLYPFSRKHGGFRRIWGGRRDGIVETHQVPGHQRDVRPGRVWGRAGAAQEACFAEGAGGSVLRSL